VRSLRKMSDSDKNEGSSSFAIIITSLLAMVSSERQREKITFSFASFASFVSKVALNVYLNTTRIRQSLLEIYM